MEGLALSAAASNRSPALKIIVTSDHKIMARQFLPEGAVFFPMLYDPRRIAYTLEDMIKLLKK